MIDKETAMDVHQQVQEYMHKMAAAFKAKGIEVELPPNSIKTNKPYYIGFEEGKSLAAAFDFNEAFTNPLKMFQGGFLCALLDDVFGPLTYMAAKGAAVTVQMNTTFIRPFMAKDRKVAIYARVVSQGKSLLVLDAEVKTLDGKLIATATNQSFIL